MPEIVAGGVIDVYPFSVDRGRPRFLTLLRTPGITLGNTWQAVHGRIHRRETTVQAAVREIQSKTGLEPESVWSIDYINNFYAPEEDTIYLSPTIGVLIATDSEVQLTPEHVSWEWVSHEVAMQRFLWIGQRLAVQTLYEEIAEPLGSGKSPNPYLEVPESLYKTSRKR